MGHLFNRYIARLLPSLTWRHFGVGALQAYLFEGETFEQRIHVWHRSLVREGIRGHGDAHNHRFSFVSKVLCGAIDSQLLTVELSEKGAFDVYEVENARAAQGRTGSHDGRCVVVARASAIAHRPVLTHAGQEYEFPRGAFHASRFLGTTVTLVTKFDQREEPARILCPHGEPLVHAFGGPEPDVKAVLRETLLAQSEAYSNAARDLPGAVKLAEKSAKRPAKGPTK